MKIGLIYGSDSGTTEDISILIHKKLSKYDVTILEVWKVNEEIILSFDFLIFGLPTWYIGELQSDWDTYFEDFSKIDFSNKLIGLFGLGDQYGYEHNFIDGVGILANIIINNNGKIIGCWSTEGYAFEASKALLNENIFFGLALDEDNQPELTNQRIDQWIELITNNKEFKALC